MDALREQPEISELMDTLDKNDMHKEKAEVESLVDYIGDMEKTLTEMLNEMRDMRQEINLIHNSSVRAKCQNLVQKTEGKIKQGLAVVGRVKDNFIQSAANAVKAFKEKGKDAFAKAVRAMKIPETLDKLTALFLICSKEIKQDAAQLKSMQSELTSAKGHLKNVGSLLVGKSARKLDEIKQDKGLLIRVSKLAEKVGKGFERLAQRAVDAADRIRVSHVKESVKGELDTLKGIKNGRNLPDPSYDR